MKQIIVCLLIMACMMSCLTLSGCDMFDKAGSEYDLYYTSNGDGTCYVSDIAVHADVTEDFTLIIPKKSPDGETVVAVKLEGKLTRFQPAELPRVVLVEDWNGFLSSFKNAENQGLSDEIASLYSQYSPAYETDPEQRQKLLEMYPLAEHTDLYILSHTPSTLLTVKSMGDAYTVAQRISYDQKVIAYAEANLSGDALNKTLDTVLYHGCEYMKHLSLPATVKEVVIPEVAFVTISFAGTKKQWEEVTAVLHGSTGVAVECKNGQGSLPGNEFYGQENTYAAPSNLPRFMLVADYEDMMVRMVESDSINHFELMKTNAYYLFASRNGLSESGKADLIAAFPIAEFCVFYWFDQNASADEMARISQYLTKYAGYTDEERARAEDKVAALEAYYAGK